MTKVSTNSAKAKSLKRVLSTGLVRIGIKELTDEVVRFVSLLVKCRNKRNIEIWMHYGLNWFLTGNSYMKSQQKFRKSREIDKKLNIGR